MKLRPRQKKQLFAFAILAVLVVMMVIYQGHLMSQYRKRSTPPVLHFSPEQTSDDLLKEISGREKNAAAEECFLDGTQALISARALMDRNLFQQALVALECANDAFSTFSTKFNLGICLFYLEDFERATDIFHQAAELRPQDCGVENFLGLCMVNTGHWKEGLNHFTSALEMARSQKKQSWEAVVLSNIGVLYRHLGNLIDAEKHHDLSLVLCQKIGYKRGEAGELVNLAHLVAARDNTDQALRIFDNALAAYREIDDGRGEASTLGYIARLYQERDDIQNASKYFSLSLDVSRRAGYRLGAAENLLELGTIAHRQAMTDQALSYYLESLDAYRQAGLAEGTSTLLGNLGLLCKDKKEYKLALKYYQKALGLDRSSRYLHGEAHDLSQIGHIYQLTGRVKEALDAYRQARELFQSLQLQDRVKETDERIKALPVSDN